MILAKKTNKKNLPELQQCQTHMRQFYHASDLEYLNFATVCAIRKYSYGFSKL